MYAYADESGHTGSNLLDPDQPVYYSVAVMSLEDIDQKYGKSFNEYANQHDFGHLHAAEMGIHRLKDFLPKLTKWIKRDTIRFFVGSIEKRWYILCKLFDFLFDPVENRGAHAQVYNIYPLRHLMLVNLSILITEDDLADAWEAIHGSNVSKSKELLLTVLQRLRERLKTHPDARSRDIIGDTLEWAEKYPEELETSFKRKRLLLAHYPNVVMFTPLMLAVEKQSEYWKSPVKRNTHDRQSQFQSSWRDLHKTLGEASDKPFGLIGGPEFKLRAAPGSSFVVGDSATSAGIQFADLVLWLMQRKAAGDNLCSEADEFMERVMRHSEPFNLSYEDTLLNIKQVYEPIMAADFSESDFKRSRKIVEEFEDGRLARIQKFEKERMKETDSTL